MVMGKLLAKRGGPRKGLRDHPQGLRRRVALQLPPPIKDGEGININTPDPVVLIAEEDKKDRIKDQVDECVGRSSMGFVSTRLRTDDVKMDITDKLRPKRNV